MCGSKLGCNLDGQTQGRLKDEQMALLPVQTPSVQGGTCTQMPTSRSPVATEPKVEQPV